ncbi:MAG: PD-(D/E)XK nuclease family protein [Pseudonocardiales bacterium]
MASAGPSNRVDPPPNRTAERALDPELTQEWLRRKASREQLRAAGIKAIERYFDAHGKEIANTEFSEKQIQVHVAPGITVDGRIDLIRRLDTGEVAIVDFKSSERAQAEDVTRDQLHIYAVGYQELTGKSADVIEVLPGRALLR